jgi:hypothetical protein
MIKDALKYLDPNACVPIDMETTIMLVNALKEALAQPERHELQAKGEHPAPCARHCEANAFQIVIKNLKAQLAQPEQEPVAWQDTRKTWVDVPLKNVLKEKRTWVGLTLEQYVAINSSCTTVDQAVGSTERQLKRNNK